jgi:flagellar hook-associated protein FlgK
MLLYYLQTPHGMLHCAQIMFSQTLNWDFLMTSISSIALSGMAAAQTTLNSSAHNIANMNTSGFRRQEVIQKAQTGGGVSTTLTTASVEGSSLETDVVSQLQSKNAFLANLSVFKTSDKMAGALLNLKA